MLVILDVIGKVSIIITSLVAIAYFSLKTLGNSNRFEKIEMDIQFEAIISALFFWVIAIIVTLVFVSESYNSFSNLEKLRFLTSTVVITYAGFDIFLSFVLRLKYLPPLIKQFLFPILGAIFCIFLIKDLNTTKLNLIVITYEVIALLSCYILGIANIGLVSSKSRKRKGEYEVFYTNSFGSIIGRISSINKQGDFIIEVLGTDEEILINRSEVLKRKAFSFGSKVEVVLSDSSIKQLKLQKIEEGYYVFENQTITRGRVKKITLLENN